MPECFSNSINIHQNPSISRSYGAFLMSGKVPQDQYMYFDPDENPSPPALCALCGPLLSVSVLVWQSGFDMVRVFLQVLLP
jgi:hypothetical protein